MEESPKPRKEGPSSGRHPWFESPCYSRCRSTTIASRHHCPLSWMFIYISHGCNIIFLSMESLSRIAVCPHSYHTSRTRDIPGHCHGLSKFTCVLPATDGHFTPGDVYFCQGIRGRYDHRKWKPSTLSPSLASGIWSILTNQYQNLVVALATIIVNATTIVSHVLVFRQYST